MEEIEELVISLENQYNEMSSYIDEVTANKMKYQIARLKDKIKSLKEQPNARKNYSNKFYKIIER